MSEFTGERVIPGQVNPDLWAEHMARYHYAAKFAARRRVLDMGCGAGYGTAELARTAASATGLDIAASAVDYARAHYIGPIFLQASATEVPLDAASFDLITAFEVIEHLQDGDALLKEGARLLAPGGIFLVSTPNKVYYAESRAEHGPNPYHHHEYEFAEFQEALARHFPHAEILLQNRLDAMALYSANTRDTQARMDSTADAPKNANFYLAICSNEPLPPLDALLYVPQASNLLREREQHIRLLEQELAQFKQWMGDITADRDRLLEQHTALQQHLDHQNRWAMDLERNWNAALARAQALDAELQETRTAYEAQVKTLEAENLAKTQWALDTERRLTAELQQHQAELARTVALLDSAETTVVERTNWAQSLQRDIETLQTTLELIRGSRWIKLGQTVGLGPQLKDAGK